ncbi:MAG TPA: NUDIX hydrolase [Candidatus Paceibacterota bacterium]
MNIQRPKSKQPMPEHAKLVFKGIVFDVYQWEQEMYDGTKQTFEKLKRPDTVLVLPILDDGKILFTKQEQPGKDPFIGLAGGRVDEGEDILEAAKRELLEETGYEASEFILYKSEHPTSKIDWVVYVFIAKGVHKISEQDLDSGEKIDTFSITFDELLEIAKDKDFIDRELVIDLLKASIDPDKKKELQELLKPL